MFHSIKENWKKDNPFRRKLVFFEGLDKTGKTTLCQKVRSASLYTVNFNDRGITGRFVFYEFRKEISFPIEDWKIMENTLIRHNIYAVIWLRTNIEIIVGRHYDAGEMLEFTIEELEQQEELYKQHIRRLGEKHVPILTLHTDKLSEDDCIEHILFWAGITSTKYQDFKEANHETTSKTN